MGVADLYRTYLSRKTVLLGVWIVRDFGGEAYGREGQAVQWVAPNRLDQFEFPDVNHGIIDALNI